MTELVSYDAARRRVYLCGRRLHHGLTGAALATIGLALMWDDRHDAPWLPTRRARALAGRAGVGALASASRELEAARPHPLVGR
jgi:hypothetical protein